MARVREDRQRGARGGVRTDRDPSSSLAPVHRRARGRARPRRSPVRAALARPDDRPVRGAASRSGSARPTRRPSRAARRACTCCVHIAGIGPGDEVITSRRSRSSPPRTASSTRAARPVFADVDPHDAEPRSGRGRGRDHRANEGASSLVDMFGYPCELDALRAIARAPRACADRRLVRGARRGVQGRADRLARPVRPCSASTRTSR